MLKLLAHLKQEALRFESYKLFPKIMDAVDLDNRLWRPAELSSAGAFRWKVTRPRAGDPASLLHFLAYCLSEQEQEVVPDVPVEWVMLVLAGALVEVIRKSIAEVNFTQPFFPKEFGTVFGTARLIYFDVLPSCFYTIWMHNSSTRAKFSAWTKLKKTRVWLVFFHKGIVGD